MLGTAKLHLEREDLPYFLSATSREAACDPAAIQDERARVTQSD